MYVCCSFQFLVTLIKFEGDLYQQWIYPVWYRHGNTLIQLLIQTDWYTLEGMAAKMAYFHQQSKFGMGAATNGPNNNGMEVSPELHVKMSKKIAQLTKVSLKHNGFVFFMVWYLSPWRCHLLCMTDTWVCLTVEVLAISNQFDWSKPDN